MNPTKGLGPNEEGASTATLGWRVGEAGGEEWAEEVAVEEAEDEQDEISDSEKVSSSTGGHEVYNPKSDCT